MEIFENLILNHWAWFILLLALLALEMMVPGVIFLWLAISAAAMGVIVFALPDISWEVQLVIYTVLSIVSVLLGKKYLKSRPVQSDDETLNKRGTQYIGHQYKVAKDFLNGEGKVRIGDTLWLVRGDFEASEGDIVTVTGTDGTVLLVKRS
jgi:membrane protein implicated in regulation of membrane protease activity